MNKYILVALSVTGGILCGLAWTSWCTGLVLLISLVPFFLIEAWLFENQLQFTRNAFFIYLLPGLVIFSILTMGWMRVASLTGAICVIMGLSFLMAFALWLAHIVRLRAGNIAAFISLITFWLTYEFISLNVNIVSPWMDLGNGLAKDIMFVQWYELTGTAGGTLWILMLKPVPYSLHCEASHRRKTSRDIPDYLAISDYHTRRHLSDKISYN